MIAKGVRFNSVKTKAGRYLGTIIFKFVMPCPECKSTLVIKTDPKRCEYLLVSGCVKYNQDVDESQIDTLRIQTPEEGEKINKNPFFKLETKRIDIAKAEQLNPNLVRLYEHRRILGDDMYLNKTLRNKLKMEKNVIKKSENEIKRLCIDIPLLEKSKEDVHMAQSAKFKRNDTSNFNARDRIRLEPIFKDKEKSTLLKKKHRMDIGVQRAFEKIQEEESFSKFLSFKNSRSTISIIKK